MKADAINLNDSAYPPVQRMMKKVRARRAEAAEAGGGRGAVCSGDGGGRCSQTGSARCRRTRPHTLT